MLLSIIIPIYNEEKDLERSIKNFSNYLAGQNYNYEIIIVNDGSTDGTGKIVAELIGRIKNLRLINLPINQGKGFAVKNGMLVAYGDYRLFIDADGSTAIEHIDKIWPLFNKGIDIIIGSRNKKDTPGAIVGTRQPYWKIFLGKCGNFLTRLLLVPNIYDTQCGFKTFTKKATEDIFPKLKINRWMFDVEILALARRLNYKIGKIPVYWTNSAFSRVGTRGYIISLKEIIKIKYNLLTGKYK